MNLPGYILTTLTGGSAGGARTGPRLDKRSERKGAQAAVSMRSAIVLAALVAPTFGALLRVVSGPDGLVGAEMPVAEFAFSPSANQTARLALVHGGDWDYARGCPPEYRGAANLRGALVMHANADIISCSPESHARAAFVVGAVGWMLYMEAWVTYDAVPGHARNYWLRGDSRRLDAERVHANGVLWFTGDPYGKCAAVDVSSRAATALVRALEAAERGTPTHATLLPHGMAEGTDAWEAQRASAGWTAARLFICLGALTMLEVALLRMWAFARAHGLSARSLVQWMLVGELIANLARLFFFAVDPFDTHGLMPHYATQLLVGLMTASAELSSGLYLYCFISSASNAGVGAHVLSARAGAGLLAFVMGAIAFEILVRFAFVGDRVLPGLSLARMLLGALLCPLSLVVGGTWAAMRVRKFLGKLPPAVLVALEGRVHSSVALHALTFLLSLLLTWGMLGPHRRTPVCWCYFTSALMTSWAHVRTYAPAGTSADGEASAVPSGPLERLASGALRLGALRLGAVLAASPTPLSSRTVAPEAERASPTPGAKIAAHLLLGVSPIYLRAFVAEHRIDRTMPTLALGRLARELTAHSRRSLLEDLVDSRAVLPGTNSPPCSAATVFISHAQSCSFVKLLDAIDAHVTMHALDPRQVFVWLDVFCARSAPRVRARARRRVIAFARALITHSFCRFRRRN